MVLNPELYKALEEISRRQGGGPPRITNAGMTFTYAVVTNDRGRKTIKPGPSEQYHIDCPFCTDKRQRLYVNHMYGMQSPTPMVPGRMLRLCFCQNEQMPKSELFSLLSDYQSALERGLIVTDKASTRQVEEINPYEQEPPTMGDTVPVHKLPRIHPAVQYLESRGYDIEYLGSMLGAQLITDHPDERVAYQAVGRVAFPFTYNGRMVMWQARLTREVTAEEKAKAKAERRRPPPKWWFPGGFNKVLWNMDLARHFPVCVITEGISSAINCGPAAMAAGGKTLLPHMVKFIAQHFEGALVMFDPDAGVSRKAGDPDYQTRAVEQLTNAGCPAISALWEPGSTKDPGDLGVSGCAELICKSSRYFCEKLGYIEGDS